MASQAARFSASVRARRAERYWEFVENVVDEIYGQYGGVLASQWGIVRMAPVNKSDQIYLFRFSDGTYWQGDPDGDFPRGVVRGRDRLAEAARLMDECGVDVVVD